MNKNDLRYRKTEKLLQTTYISLKNGDTAIKVSDLCREAMLNKTTFYDHYECIEHLHEQVCNCIIVEILQSTAHINDLFVDTRAFVTSLVQSFTATANQKLLHKLYGTNWLLLVNRIEEELLQIYLSESDDYTRELQIRFAIGGSLRVLLENQDSSHIDMVIDMIKRILPQCNTP